MFSVPVSFLFDFGQVTEQVRPYVMHEFAANGAKHLILSSTLISNVMKDLPLQKILLEEMAAEGLTFMDAHAPYGPMRDLICPVAEARPQMLLRQKLTLQILADMGVKTITIHTGNETHYPGYDLEVMYDCMKRSLDELLPMAEKLGIVICIENIWYQINTPERLLGIKKEFPTDALGLCYDSGHANVMDKGRNFPDSNPFKYWKDGPPQFDDRILEKMLPQVVNCHLHDNDGSEDSHLLPGEGNIDWEKTMTLLKQAPRLQVIQSEVKFPREKLSVRKLCETFRQLLKQGDCHE